MRKRICIALLVMTALLLSGCARSVNYSDMTAEEIFIHEMKCSEEQARYIAYVLEQCGAGRIQEIQQGNHKRYWLLTYPEGKLELQLDNDKNLFSIANQFAFPSGMLLFVCAGHILDGVHIEEDTVLGTLISSQTERQYYLDTSLSMITSIEDMLVVEEVEVNMYGIKRSEPEFSDPVFLDYEGESFVYRSSDGMVHVGYNIYSDGSSYANNRGVKFSFEAEFAMLYPVSFQLNAKGPEGEMIDYVSIGAYYETFGAFFDNLRERATSRTSPFTEDEIHQAQRVLHKFLKQYSEVSVCFQAIGANK